MHNETITNNTTNEVNRINENISGLVENFINSCTAQEEALWSPDVDVRETTNEFILQAALPGVRKEDVETELRDNLLTVSGKRTVTAGENDVWLGREVPYGRFSRSFKIGARFKAAEIKAALRDGILEVRIPKADDEKPNRIPID